MKRTFATIILLLGTFAAQADEVAESCQACHKDGLSLHQWESNLLAMRILQMRDGTAAHVVPIAKLSDEEVAALAAALIAR